MIQSVWKNLTGLQKAAEHLWCDFKWATNSSPNTNDLYIHYMDKSTGTPSLEEKKHFQTVPTKKWMYLKIVFPPLLHQFWSELLYPCVQVIGVWWWRILSDYQSDNLIIRIISGQMAIYMWLLVCHLSENSLACVKITITQPLQAHYELKPCLKTSNRS